MKIKPNFRKLFGFTLIEMLVTMGVLTLLTSMVLVYSRQGESLSNLIRDSDRLVFNLNQAKNLSLLTLHQGDSRNICGWGIHFDSNNSYKIFHDYCNGGTGDQQYNPGEETETITLLKGIEIFKWNVDDVIFIPPEPRVKFTNFKADGEEDDNASAFIRMRLIGDKSKPYYRIRINLAGQISKQLKDSSSDKK